MAGGFSGQLDMCRALSPITADANKFISTTHIAGVQAACQRGVSRALNDGPAVGKKRHFIRVMLELQHKVVVTHYTMRLKPKTHFGKIDGPMAFMDLH